MVIYKITNTTNCKVYIGQTRNFSQRMSQHFIKDSKDDSLLRRAIKKYGKESFTKEIIFESESQEAINKMEILEIKLNKSQDRRFGYNIKPGGDNHGHSEETKKKIGESQKGELNHMYGKKGAENKTSKKLIELKTNTIFQSVTIAAEILGLNLSHIASVCRGKRSSTGGYVFRYLDDNNKIIDVEAPKKNRARRIINLDTKEVFNSFKEIENKLNKKIDSGNIIKNIKGKTKTSYGYRWNYID